MKRSRVLWLVVGLLLGSTAATTAAASSSVAAGTAQTDVSASQRLREAFDEARSAAGFGPYFVRPSFQAAAKRDALALADDVDLAGGPAQGHGFAFTTVASPGTLEARITSLIRNAAAINQLPELTDGGWSVATRVVDANTIHVGLMVWIGVPPSPVGHVFGCSSTGGYCWRSLGLNYHEPWIRNQLRWWVSTSGLTDYRLRVVKRAISMVDAVAGFGADVVLGGRTSAVAPTARRQFVLRWTTSGRACGSVIPLGCLHPGGADGTISRALLQVRSNAMPQTKARLDRWTAVVAHEMLHGLGLDHFDKVYTGSYQLMRSTETTLSPQAGDRHGMARLAPPGQISATLLLPPGPVPAGQPVDAFVKTSGTGLGGIRSIVVRCTDVMGQPQALVTQAGSWDILPTTAATPWTVPAEEATRYTSTCVAVVRSKASEVTSAPVTIELGGTAP
jgi:hypothetical protein